MNVLALSGCEQAHFEPLARILKRIKPNDDPQVFFEAQGVKASVFFVCQKGRGAGKFIYDMVSRWLIPGRAISIPLFFVTDFELDGKEWTAGEVAFVLQDLGEVQQAKKGFKLVQKELVLGLSSPFFAERVLELKGLSGREKLARVQERLSQLCSRFGLDNTVMMTLQQFASKCSPLFIQERSISYLTRLVLHLDAGKDKCMPVVVDSPLGIRHGLGCIINRSFCTGNEVFEKTQALKAIGSVLPKSVYVESSYEEIDDLLYLEIEKKTGDAFSLMEIQKLNSFLRPQEFTRQLVHPVFLPRNEEEIMRGLISLSHELRFVRDLPQVTITFDGQQGDQLRFTVLIVRLGVEPELSQLIGPEFKVERIREMGLLRSRYVKQAHITKILLDESLFLREDGAVDTLQARQKVSAILKSKIGVFRDFNGGIIAREQENFESLKSQLKNVSVSKLQEFFYSIEPAHLRSVLGPEALKALYLKRKDQVI
ncbi:MAG: hypothetical protein KDK44_00710 [Chlamydiia bacterium]|nr:hypothetical protein [Chlamydiia bacterium]